MERLTEKYPEDFLFVYRHFPLNTIHDKAAIAAHATEAAGLQGKFWEMHDAIFEKQAEWSSLEVTQFNTWLADEASDLKLNVAQFKKDLESQAIADKVQAAYDRANEIGLPGTPFILINGQVWPDTVPLNEANLSTMIELLRLEKRQFDTCPPMTIDAAKTYVAHVQTERGEIVLELFAEDAPLAVNNFVFLARNGWYDGVTFHRVVKDFVAQAGDPTGTGYGGPGYAFTNEIVPELIFDREGVLAMANSGADSNGSQFFITFGPAENLNGGYTIFGQVIEGMEVVRLLTLRDPSQNADLPPGDKILKVTIEEK
jgi:cyclophilin family peptidyl-prolyl cis-trans isomerase